jgi:hypothetical protein
MKKTLIFALLGILFLTATVKAQVKIYTGAAPANNSAVSLMCSDVNKGVLPNQVALTAINDGTTILLPPNGLLVYNTGAGGLLPAGYYFNSGTAMFPIWDHFVTNNTFVIPYYQRYAAFSAISNAAYFLNGTGYGWNSFDMADVNTIGFTAAPITIASNSAPFYSTYVASSNGIFKGFRGWALCEHPTKTNTIINIYVYKYTPVNNSNTNMTGTLIGSQTITCTSPLYNYSINFSGNSNSALNAGDIVIVFCNTSNWAAGNGTFYLDVMGSIEIQN